MWMTTWRAHKSEEEAKEEASVLQSRSVTAMQCCGKPQRNTEERTWMNRILTGTVFPQREPLVCSGASWMMPSSLRYWWKKGLTLGVACCLWSFQCMTLWGLLQKLHYVAKSCCRRRCGREDNLPYDIQQHWMKWLEEIFKISESKIGRHIKPNYFGRPILAQLHNFSDTSGYGTESYVRVRIIDSVHITFIFGKGRVALLKQVTKPRWSLQLQFWLCLWTRC